MDKKNSQFSFMMCGVQ